MHLLGVYSRVSFLNNFCPLVDPRTRSVEVSRVLLFSSIIGLIRASSDKSGASVISWQYRPRILPIEITMKLRTTFRWQLNQRTKAVRTNKRLVSSTFSATLSLDTMHARAFLLLPPRFFRETREKVAAQLSSRSLGASTDFHRKLFSVSKTFRTVAKIIPIFDYNSSIDRDQLWRLLFLGIYIKMT